jgi:hypothetical protein
LFRFLRNPKENQDFANTPDQDEDRFQGQDITEVTDEPKVNCRYADEFSIGHGEINVILSLQFRCPFNSEIATVNCLLFASLLLSLLATFVTTLGKRWLNRYLQHAGGSIIEQGNHHQRKFDRLQQRSFPFVIESLPMLRLLSFSLPVDFADT